MPADPILFLHILKTAGTAFRNYLEQVLPPDERILELGNWAEAETALERLRGMNGVDRARLRVVYGHMAEVFRQDLAGAPYATVIRSPLRRALSQYVYEHFNLENLGLEAGSRPLPGDVPSSEFWDLFLCWGTSYEAGNFNLQARTIAGFLGLDPKEITDKDIPGLVDRFAIIGVQDHFALFVFLFCRTYDFPLRPVPVVYSFAQGFEDYVPRWVQEEADRAGSLDAELYRQGRKKFDTMVARLFETDPGAEAAWREYAKETQALMEQEFSRKLAQAQ